MAVLTAPAVLTTPEASTWKSRMGAAASHKIAMAETTRPTTTAASSVQFAVVSYPERLAEILELRRIALCAANQIAPQTPAAEMFEPRDVLASIMIAELDGRLIGTMRVTPPLDGPILHHANICLGPVVGLPPSADYLEASNACVHPAHQGQGILWQLAAQMIITAKKLAKPYLVGGAKPGMYPFWQRCGFRKTGTVYVRPDSLDVERSIIVLNVEAAIAGRDISPQLAQALSPLLANA